MAWNEFNALWTLCMRSADPSTFTVPKFQWFCGNHDDASVDSPSASASAWWCVKKWFPNSNFMVDSLCWGINWDNWSTSNATFSHPFPALDQWRTHLTLDGSIDVWMWNVECTKIWGIFRMRDNNLIIHLIGINYIGRRKYARVFLKSLWYAFYRNVQWLLGKAIFFKYDPEWLFADDHMWFQILGIVII